jgi:OPA family sugar phosphate sensor protein UhpC-like MFS transporter
MAVDIAPKKASGAALGVVGIASYAGAGIQDILSGHLIEANKTVVEGVVRYDFSMAYYYWIGAAVLSVGFCGVLWWVSRRTNVLKVENNTVKFVKE